jgi:epsilon-lactone hydrolase
MPSSEFRQVLEVLRERAIARRGYEQDLKLRRQELDAFGALNPPPPNTERFEVPASPVVMERLARREGASEQAILYLHGGGYCRGSIRSHAGLAGRLAEASGADVYLFDYRLAPEHPFPAALEDALAAFRWLTGHAGYAPHSTALVGDSAGGGLAVAVLLTLRSSGLGLPASAALISPWLDMRVEHAGSRPTASSDPVITIDDLKLSTAWYLGGCSPDHPLVSPVLADLSGLPPLLVQVGTEEILLGDSLLFDQASRRAGVPIEIDVVEGMIHCWPLFPNTPESDAAVARIASFVTGHWSHDERPNQQ